MSVSLSVSLCIFLSLYVCLSIFLSLFNPLYLSLSISVFSLSVCISLSFYVYILLFSLYFSLSFFRSLSFYTSLSFSLRLAPSPSVFLRLSVSLRLSFYLYLRLSIYLSVSCLCIFVSSCTCLSVFVLSLYLSVSLYVYLSHYNGHHGADSNVSGRHPHPCLPLTFTCNCFGDFDGRMRAWFCHRLQSQRSQLGAVRAVFFSFSCTLVDRLRRQRRQWLEKKLYSNGGRQPHSVSRPNNKAFSWIQRPFIHSSKDIGVVGSTIFVDVKQAPTSTWWSASPVWFCLPPSARCSHVNHHESGYSQRRERHQWSRLICRLGHAFITPWQHLSFIIFDHDVFLQRLFHMIGGGYQKALHAQYQA